MGRSIAGDYTRFAAFSLAVASGECLAGKELPQASRPSPWPERTPNNCPHPAQDTRPRDVHLISRMYIFEMSVWILGSYQMTLSLHRYGDNAG